MELCRQAHCVYRCLYHLVWILRARDAVLVNGVDQYLLIKLEEIRKLYPEIEYIERNVQPDHVRLVVSVLPRQRIAKIVQLLKANTARALKEQCPFLQARYRGAGGIWSVGYFVSTVGVDEERIKRHVRYQEKEDLGQAKLALSKKPRTSVRGN